jgi:chemotaxis response regulator CheB
VYLIFRNQLFSDAIGALLGTYAEIELVGANDNPNQVATDISTLAPDVVLLEGTDGAPAISDVYTILSNPLPFRVITLGLDEDGMHVWSQTWRQTVRPRDLVEAIIAAGDIKP